MPEDLHEFARMARRFGCVAITWRGWLVMQGFGRQILDWRFQIED